MWRTAKKEVWRGKKSLKRCSQNGYPVSFILDVERKKLRKLQEAKKETETEKVTGCPHGWVSLPYVRGLSEPVARVLRPLGINVAHRAEPWKWRVCRNIKDQLQTNKRKGVVYMIGCEDCSSAYVGETGKTLADRCAEHQRHTRLGAADKSAVAEHALTLGHNINWKSAKVLNTAPGFVQRRVKERLHIERLAKTRPLMNKDKGVKIEQFWLSSV